MYVLPLTRYRFLRLRYGLCAHLLFVRDLRSPDLLAFPSVDGRRTSRTRHFIIIYTKIRNNNIIYTVDDSLLFRQYIMMIIYHIIWLFADRLNSKQKRSTRLSRYNKINHFLNDKTAA